MSELDTFGAVLEVMPDAVVVVADDGRIVAANRHAEQLTGYSRDELIGAAVEMLVPDGMDAAHHLHRAAYFGAAQPRPMGTGLDIRVRRKDGQEIPADIALSPLQLDGRRLALASVRDIGERRRIEQELRESEERQRLLIDGVTDYAIYMLDPQGNVTTWNRGAERLKGYSGEEIVGRHVSAFYPSTPRREEKARRELEVAAAEGRLEVQGWRVRKDGSRFWADVVITPLRDPTGELRGFAKITRDVTVQRRAARQVEAALAVAQAMLAGRGSNEVLELVARRARRLLDASLAAVVEPDPSGGLVVSVADGARASRLRGFRVRDDEKSMSGRVMETGRGLLVDDLTRDPRAHRRAAELAGLGAAIGVPLARDGALFGALIIGNAPGGPRFEAADLAAAHFLATQASLALEHARIQEELQRLALVDERERIGRELHDGAIQAIFAIGMSLEGLAARTADEGLAGRLRATVAQLDGVIKDLRNYIYGLRPSIVREQHLEQALRQLVDDFAGGSGVTTVADIEPAAAQALGDQAGEVVLLAGEALSNVGRHAEALTARLTLRSEGAEVILEIEDDGVGFDPGRRRGEGQGLRNLVERAAGLGGQAEIESSPGEGTTVRFRLPGESQPDRA